MNLTDAEILEITLTEARLIEKATRIADMKERGIETFHSERDLSLSIEAMIRDTKNKLNQTYFVEEIKLNAALK